MRRPCGEACGERVRCRRETARWLSTGHSPTGLQVPSEAGTGSPMNVIAVYPGSFDPLTNGHVDIIERGARLFDRIIVAILINAEKSPMFTMAERVEIARAVFKNHPNVEVDTFEGLLVDYVARRKANVIVRGL